jgi:hypothetical protein
MDARSNFKARIVAYDDLRGWLALADQLTPASPVIGAARFCPAMHPAQKSPGKRASGSAGSLMAPQRAEMVPPCRD